MSALLNFAVIYPELPIVLALVLGCAVRWFLAPADRKRTEWLLVASGLAIPATMLAEGIANALSILRPLKYDEFVYRIDGWFGEPSFYLGRLAHHSPFLTALISISYGLLSVMMVAVLFTYLYLRSESETVTVVKAFALNLFAAVPIYLLFPVCGPGIAFPEFPNPPGSFTAHPLLLHAAPNGVPSVHTSTAILIMLFLWPWRWGKVTGVVFLCLTILATLGSGQHYAFDLLCAMPYAWAVWVVAHWARKPVLVAV